MDAHKLDTLRAIGYRIREVCGMCEHGSFGMTGSWGTCEKQPYEHGKHTLTTRQLSIHVFGNCPRFTPRLALVEQLYAFREFFCTTEQVKP